MEPTGLPPLFVLGTLEREPAANSEAGVEAPPVEVLLPDGCIPRVEAGVAAGLRSGMADPGPDPPAVETLPLDGIALRDDPRGIEDAVLPSRSRLTTGFSTNVIISSSSSFSSPTPPVF